MSDWIKCSDRLPDNEGYRIVYEFDVSVGYYEYGNWYVYGCNDWDKVSGVTHWKELPDGPKS